MKDGAAAMSIVQVMASTVACQNSRTVKPSTPFKEEKIR